MQHILFGSNKPTFKVAILIKDTSFNKERIEESYLAAFQNEGIQPEDVFAVSLPYINNKASAALIKDTFDVILPQLEKLGTDIIYCCDANYFKTLAKEAKAEPHIGYIKEIKYIKTDMKVAYGINYSSVVYDPKNKNKLDMTNKSVSEYVSGKDQSIGNFKLYNPMYPTTLADIANTLQWLKSFKKLTVDIEAFSLRLDKAFIGSISFAPDKTTGAAFLVDYKPIEQQGTTFGMCIPNKVVRDLLRQFFDTYQGKLVAHNGSYDFRVLVYNLYMEHPLDYKGMNQGIDVFTRLFDDTKIIAYLATNSCAGNEIGLKTLGHPYAGNYAVDVKDITKVSWQKLLEYNLIDACTTWWVYDKYYPMMVKDQQEELYQGLFKDSFKVIMQMELTGMPMHDSLIRKAKNNLVDVAKTQYLILAQAPEVAQALVHIKEAAVIKANKKLKVLVKTVDDFKKLKFNPNSSQQIAILLHIVMGLPVMEVTETGQPATGMEALENLINHTNNASYKKTIQALIDLAKVSKILSAFIPAFENGILKSDGMRWLHGNFNLGGTLSGRLSSSDPNMQNLPSGSTYGKLIKGCFTAPKGWVLVFADFNA